MNLEKQNNKNDDFISQQKVYTSSCSRFESVIVGSSNNLLHSLSFPHYTYIFSIFLNQTISNHSIYLTKNLNKPSTYILVEPFALKRYHQLFYTNKHEILSCNCYFSS